MNATELVRALGASEDAMLGDLGYDTHRPFITFDSTGSPWGAKLEDGNLLTWPHVKWAVAVIREWAAAEREDRKPQLPTEAFWVKARKLRG